MVEEAITVRPVGCDVREVFARTSGKLYMMVFAMEHGSGLSGVGRSGGEGERGHQEDSEVAPRILGRRSTN